MSKADAIGVRFFITQQAAISSQTFAQPWCSQFRYRTKKERASQRPTPIIAKGFIFPSQTAMRNIRLLFILVITTAGPAGAAIYKWVDEEGKVHFGDRPTSAQAQQLKLHKNPQPATSTTPNAAQRQITQQRMLEIYQQEREEKKAAKKRRKEDAKKRAQQCADARDKLRQYERYRLYKNLPNGEREYLSDSERERSISKLKNSIKRHCK